MDDLSEISILLEIKFHLQGIIELLSENPRVKIELVPDALFGLVGGSGTCVFVNTIYLIILHAKLVIILPFYHNQQCYGKNPAEAASYKFNFTKQIIPSTSWP